MSINTQANLAAVKVLPTRSAAVRSYNESHLLEALSGRLATVAMSGLMFFGSSVLMSDKVGIGCWLLLCSMCCVLTCVECCALFSLTHPEACSRYLSVLYAPRLATCCKASVFVCVWPLIHSLGDNRMLCCCWSGLPVLLPCPQKTHTNKQTGHQPGQ